MKRVTERADLTQKNIPQFISGCRHFEGEDLGKCISNLIIDRLRQQDESAGRCAEAVDPAIGLREAINEQFRVRRGEQLRQPDQRPDPSARHDGGRHDHEETIITEGAQGVQPQISRGEETEGAEVERAAGEPESIRDRPHPPLRPQGRQQTDCSVNNSAHVR